MKLKIIILFVCCLPVSLTLLGQEVKELLEIESGAEYWDIWEKTRPLINSDTNAAILIFEEAFNKTDNNFTKSALMRQFGGLYIDTKDIKLIRD